MWRASLRTGSAGPRPSWLGSGCSPALDFVFCQNLFSYLETLEGPELLLFQFPKNIQKHFRWTLYLSTI